TPVRHVDVLPTVLDAVGIGVPADLPGRSLLSVIARGGHGQGPQSYFEALSSSLNQGWAPLHGLLDGALKFVDLPIPELYDLATAFALAARATYRARSRVAGRPSAGVPTCRSRTCTSLISSALVATSEERSRRPARPSSCARSTRRAFRSTRSISRRRGGPGR